jgi:hypothetical protein
MGLAVWGMDEAGPYQAIPQPGIRWQPVGRPARYPHEHVRHGTAKMLTLFHPATGQVRVKGVTSCPNVVLHAWLEAVLLTILEALPPAQVLDEADNRAAWERWQAGLTVKPTLCDKLPPLRLLLIMDKPQGTHHRELRRVVVRTWRDAAVHPAQRVVADHDRIHPAHLGQQGAGRSDAGTSDRTHLLAGGHGARLER